jgi:hypothetical protein
VGALQQNLMRYPGWNADRVPRTKLLADTALDRPIAFFVGLTVSPFSSVPPTSNVAVPD